MKAIEHRLAALEARRDTTASPVTRIVVMAAGTDDGFTLERQPSGAWDSRPVTQEDVNACPPLANYSETMR